MTEYVGLDFGNSMVKAAVVESPDGPPRTLRLTERDPFLPLALRVGSSGYRAGWSAFSHRRRDGANTVAAMRDRWNSSAKTASLGGRPQPVAVLLGEFLAAAGARIQRAAKDPAGVVVTVPDSWDHQNWSLPVAARNAGWSPEAYAREWVAALAISKPATVSAVVLLSLGNSAARATFCRSKDGAWKAVRSAAEPAVSGTQLRKRMIAEAAETAIHQARRDPREDPETDQDLCDSVEAALYQLHRQPQTAVEFTLAGKPLSMPVSRSSLASLAGDFPAAMERLIATVCGDSKDGRNCPAIVWGELTGLLPVKEWLAARGKVKVLSLDSLAAGAARLCAEIVTGKLKPSLIPTAAVCPQCGSYSALKTTAECPQCRQPLVAVWETLPAVGEAAKTETAAAAVAVLRLIDGAADEQKSIEADHFRLGRSPKSDWVFSDNQYPSVSSAHAVITRDGDNYRIRDLGSTNGTLLNGARISEEHELTPGDEIRLSQAGPRLMFELCEG